jgi:putative DNA primase/helicase
VLTNTVVKIMGDYATVAPMEAFTASSRPQHPTDLAALRGARLVTAQETEQGRHWAESKVKMMTGGDPITARFMRQNFFTYQPQFKLWITGNDKPGLRSVGEDTRRRFNLIPFSETIPREERDGDLQDKLVEEWPAILRWLIDGCLEWQANGLNPPQAVSAATDTYFEEEDAFGGWVGECCETNRACCERSGACLKSYNDWAERSNEPKLSSKEFRRVMEARGFAYGRKNSARLYLGLRLLGQQPNYNAGLDG